MMRPCGGWVVPVITGWLVLAGPNGPATPARWEAVSWTLGGDAALRGLTSLGVHAEQTNPQLWQLGVSDVWLRDQVAVALQEARVPLLEPVDALARERQPLLVVRLQTTLIPARAAVAWHLSLAVYERVTTLGGARDTTLAQVWAAPPTLGLTSGEALRPSLRRSLAGMTKEFLRAWSRRDSADAGARARGVH